MEPILDSNLSAEEALLQNPLSLAPEDIINQQTPLDVTYYGFDGQMHQGQIVVNKLVADNVMDFFKEAVRTQFPIQKVIPIADKQYQWNDDTSCADNNSSGFNYRTIAGTDRLSNHATGYAFDINPVQNPYIRWKDGVETYRVPVGSTYKKDVPGTLHADHPLVTLLTSRGWTWGGNWIHEGNVVDYQHFEYKQ
jgi:hypothetical protein